MLLETFLAPPRTRYIFEHEDSWATVFDASGELIEFRCIRFSAHKTIRIIGKIGDACTYVPCKSLDLPSEERDIQVALGVLPDNNYHISPVKRIWCAID